jgi:hypothetical protein
MKANERRLLTAFVVLAVLFAVVFGTQWIRGWQRRIERREREAELAQMEAATLLAEAPIWIAKDNWLSQKQPEAESESQANEGLLEHLRSSAASAGIEISKTQIEPAPKMEYYRQFGVSLLLKGDLPVIMRWTHGLLAPETFYVVPQLRITPDKDDPKKVTALVRVWRWYRPELAAAKEVGI